MCRNTLIAKRGQKYYQWPVQFQQSQKIYISQNLKLRFLSFLHQSTILRCPIRDATLPNEQRQRFMEEISRASASTFSQAKLPWTRQAKTAGQTFFIIYCFFSHFLCIDCLLTFRDKTWPYPISVPELMNILNKKTLL